VTYWAVSSTIHTFPWRDWVEPRETCQINR